MVDFLIIGAVCWRTAIVGETMGKTVGINESRHDKEEGSPRRLAMPFAIVNRAPARAIFCDHDLACFAFLVLVLKVSGLLLDAHALTLRCLPWSSLPLACLQKVWDVSNGNGNKLVGHNATSKCHCSSIDNSLYGNARIGNHGCSGKFKLSASCIMRE